MWKIAAILPWPQCVNNSIFVYTRMKQLQNSQTVFVSLKSIRNSLVYLPAKYQKESMSAYAMIYFAGMMTLAPEADF